MCFQDIRKQFSFRIYKKKLSYGKASKLKKKLKIDFSADKQQNLTCARISVNIYRFPSKYTA